MDTHPKGSHARVLMSSVFGPYAQDDEFGSRSINPMELYHNQVTKAQGAFSLRMFHRSWGIMMIQQNISAPTTVLDFPTREAFERELTTQKLRHRGHFRDHRPMWGRCARCAGWFAGCRRGPRSSSEVTSPPFPGLDMMIDADHIVRGDGISWMRRYLGEDEAAPIRHPHIVSGFGLRVMGVRMPHIGGATAATIIPSVGCPMGCNFCTTSAFFGGKGKSLNFYETGRELFDVMCEMEAAMDVKARSSSWTRISCSTGNGRWNLLDCMKKANKSWAFYVFSSANAIRRYTMEELVELGVSWLWMGLESPKSSYSKLNGTDTVDLARELRGHGIKLLGSTIVGLEHHTPENIGAEIEHAVSHNTDFHQFMLYTPVPGTPLYDEISEQGRMLDGVDYADIHGQYKFNFEHAAISRDDSKRFLDWAFRLDFEKNGPSLYRIWRTTLEGWKRYQDHPEPRVRRRFDWEVRQLKTASGAVLWAMERRLKKTNEELSRRIRSLRREIGSEFGGWGRTVGALVGPDPPLDRA